MAVEHSQPGPDFRWRPESWGPVLSATPLEGSSVHFFTTRALPLRGDSTVDADGWNRVAAAAGVPRDRLLRVHQVHGVQIVAGRSGQPHVSKPVGDIIISNDPGLALAVQVADCVPLLLSDAATGAVAAVHAGWRGTLAGAAAEAVRALAAQFGTRPADLVAAVGPSIGPCCYQVGEEVRHRFAEGRHGRIADRWFRERDGLRLDLWTANRDQLVEAGVPRGRIATAGLCTACLADLYHSYRRDGAGTGRMAGVIRILPGASPGLGA